MSRRLLLTVVAERDEARAEVARLQANAEAREGVLRRREDALRRAERERDEARREERKAIAAWLTRRMEHFDASLVERMLLRELIDVVESGEVPHE